MKHPLRAYRNVHGLSMADLADQLGVRTNTIWRWENGRVPEQAMWARIEKVTGIKPDQIVRFVVDRASLPAPAPTEGAAA